MLACADAHRWATVPGQSSARSTSLGIGVSESCVDWLCAMGISLLGVTAITFSTPPLSAAYGPVLWFAATLTQATRIAERKGAEEMDVRYSPGVRRTLDAAESYAAAFIADLRALNLTPHIAQNGWRSAIATPCGEAEKGSSRKPLGFARPMLRGAKKLGDQIHPDDGQLQSIRLPKLIGAVA